MGINEVAANNIAINVNGKEYKLRKLNIDDLSAIEEYIRSRKMGDIAAIKGLEAADKRELIVEILKNPIDDNTVDNFLNTYEGMRFMLYRALMNNEGITLTGIGEMFSNDDLMLLAKAIMPTEENPIKVAEVASQ